MADSKPFLSTADALSWFKEQIHRAFPKAKFRAIEQVKLGMGYTGAAFEILNGDNITATKVREILSRDGFTVHESTDEQTHRSVTATWKRYYLFSYFFKPSIGKHTIAVADEDHMLPKGSVRLSADAKDKPMPAGLSQIGELNKPVHDSKIRSLAKKLSSAERDALKDSDFCYVRTKPDGTKIRKYPIPDLSHAKNALSRVSQFGNAKMKALVRKKVYKKYPQLKNSKTYEKYRKKHGKSLAPADKGQKAKDRKEKNIASVQTEAAFDYGAMVDDNIASLLNVASIFDIHGEPAIESTDKRTILAVTLDGGLERITIKSDLFYHSPDYFSEVLKQTAGILTEASA